MIRPRPGREQDGCPAIAACGLTAWQESQPHARSGRNRRRSHCCATKASGAHRPQPQTAAAGRRQAAVLDTRRSVRLDRSRPPRSVVAGMILRRRPRRGLAAATLGGVHAQCAQERTHGNRSAGFVTGATRSLSALLRAGNGGGGSPSRASASASSRWRAHCTCNCARQAALRRWTATRRRSAARTAVSRRCERPPRPGRRRPSAPSAGRMRCANCGSAASATRGSFPPAARGPFGARSAGAKPWGRRPHHDAGPCGESRVFGIRRAEVERYDISAE